MDLHTGLKVELVRELEPISFTDNSGQQVTMKKYEAYLHDESRKYPTSLDLYLTEPLALGFHQVTVDLEVRKGKIATRVVYTPLSNDESLVRTPSANESKISAHLKEMIDGGFELSDIKVGDVEDTLGIKTSRAEIDQLWTLLVEG